MKSFYSHLRSNIELDIKLDEKDPLAEFHESNKTCLLCSQCSNIKLPGYGVAKPKLMVIGGVPSQYDLDVGVVFSDNLGKKLHGMLSYVNRQCNIINNMYYTNLSWCLEMRTICKSRIEEEIGLVNPKLILLLGQGIANVFFDDCKIGDICTINVGKYYDALVTHSLKDVLFRNAEVKQEVKQHMDMVIRKLNDPN